MKGTNEFSDEPDLLLIAVHQALFKSRNQMYERTENAVFASFPRYPLVSDEKICLNSSEYKLSCEGLLRFIRKLPHSHDSVVKKCEDTAHGMNRSPKMTSMMNKGVGNAAAECHQIAASGVKE
jgi:hypothetical protein